MDEKYRLALERRVLGPLLRERARTEGDRVYLASGGRSFSFRDTDRIVRAVGRGLKRHGIAKGDRIALFLPNGAQFVFAWYACAVVGAVMVPVNTSYTGYLLEYVLTDSTPRGIVCGRELVAALGTVRREVLERIDWVAVVGGPEGLALPGGPKHYLDYDSLLVHEGPDPEAALDFRDIHGVMYTSGTTGPSKGVVMPNAHFFSSGLTFIKATDFGRDDVLFTCLPLFHGLASRLGVLPALISASKVVIAERFSASQFWKQAADAGATVGHTIFTLPAMLKAQPPGPYDRAHRLRAMFNANYDAEFERRFGVRLCESYGLTETGQVICSAFSARRPGSCGTAHEEWEVELFDEMDRPVPGGETGEVVARPRRPSIMMREYLNKPEETLRAWRNLWFHTGDFARRDEDGYYYFAGRKKERIRRRGENISAFEIETIVCGHPDVAECAALPHPADPGEDDVRVVVALRRGAQLTAVELMDWLQGRMPYFMMPRYVEFVRELPRTLSNKVEKYKLIDQGLSPAAWDREAAGYRVERNTGNPAGGPPGTHEM